MKRLIGTLLLAGIAMTTMARSEPAETGSTAPGSADARFQALYTREWAWRQQQFPGLDDEDRVASANDNRLPAVDAKTQATRLAYWQDVLRLLAAIAPKDLSAANQVNYAVYKPQIENLAADVRFRAYEMPLNSDSQFWSDLAFMANRPLKSAAEAENYIARLNDVPRYFDEQIVNMRAGLKRGFSVPRAVLGGRDVSISTYIEVDNAQDSPFYKPFKQLPTNIPATAQAKLQAD
ncbi:MAG: DUF885 family protein, partial [Rudaea sp.]